MLLSSCGSIEPYSIEKAHQRFLQELNGHVGMSINSESHWAKRAATLSREELPNGGIKYRQRVGKGCVAVFLVETKSQRIIGADWEGEKGSCILPV